MRDGAANAKLGHESAMKSERTIIVGGGIAGLSTAWWLAQSGHEVTLFESASAVGQQATAQNAWILRSATGQFATAELTRETTRFLKQPPQGFVEAPLVDRVGFMLLAKAGQTPAWLEFAEPDTYVALDSEQVARRAPQLSGGGSARAWRSARCSSRAAGNGAS